MKKMFLKILAVIIAFVFLLLFIAAFTAKKYTIKREITINAPEEKVYNYVRFHKNQKEFNQWLSYDPNVKIEIKGNPDGQAGSILHYESKNKKLGVGELENIRLMENKRIDYQIRFFEPYSFIANGSFHFEALNSKQSKVLWEYHGGMNWPMNISLLFIDMNKIIGSDLQHTLNKIKLNIEKR